jgi:lysophospholipase L1-like esterase
MTIILSQSYGAYANGATVDLDNATEAALVAQGRASYSGTAPTSAFQPLTAAEQQNLRDVYLTSSGGPAVTSQQLASIASSGTFGKPLRCAIGDSLLEMTHLATAPTAASRSSGIVTVTFTGHGLFPGARFRLDGLPTLETTPTVAGFDTSLRGTWTVSSVVDANNFRFACPGDDSASLALNGSNTRVQNLQRRTNNGFLNWAQILGNQAFTMGGIFACSGRLTDNMLQFVPSVIASGAAYCDVLGGTNDVMPVGINTARTATQILANLRAIHAALRAGGVRPIIWTIPPIDPGASYSAARTRTINQVNAGLRQDCAQNGMNILVDLYAALVDTANATQIGSSKANYIIAGDVHPTQRGAYYGGKAAAAALSGQVQRIDARITNPMDNQTNDPSSANIFDTAPWIGSGGALSGITAMGSWITATA